MKISLAQLNYSIGDFEANSKKIIDAIERAKNEDSKLIVFTEMALCGAPAYDLLGDISFLEKCDETLNIIAKHCDNITALIGTPYKHTSGTISTVAIVRNSRVEKYIGKKKINNRQEAAYIAPSEGCEFIEVDGHKIAVVLGEDVLVENEYGIKPELIINCYKSIYSRGIVERRHQYFSNKAFELGKTLILTNIVGGNTDIIYDGNSTVYNSRGELILMMKPFAEDFVTFNPFEQNTPIEFPAQDKTHNVYSAIKLGLSDYFRKNGFKKACVGLSGGIDSAVVCAMCAETLGAENVHALMMPSQYSTDHSISDAVELANNLGIQYDIVPIRDIFDTTRKTMAPVFGNRDEDVTEENMQSRIRGLLLMSYSNKFGSVVINCSNKSEAAVGYGTMYGDTIGALSLLGDLYKMEVYDLARHINRNGEIIPRSIIDKEPSAELRPDQKDSDSLPVYEVLDSILYRLIEQNQSVEEIAEVGFDQEEVAQVARLVRRNEYKRNQFCPVLKLSTQAFNKDRQMPITAKYQF